MEQAMKQRLTRRDIWMRGLFMVFFVIAYSIAEIVIAFVAVFQFLVVLFTGSANENLLRLGNNLSTYVYQVLAFLTFTSEVQPFPFSDWPDEPLEDNVWLEGAPAAAEPAAAEPAPAEPAPAETAEPRADDSDVADPPPKTD